MADGENRDVRATVAEGDLIQVNEDGPQNWFRCLLVVDEVRPFGVVAYCVIPGIRNRCSNDAYMRLSWREFDALGAKSKFVAAKMPETSL